MSSETNNEEKVVKTENVPAEAAENKAQEVNEIEDTTPKKFLRYSKTESVIRIIIALVFGIFLMFFAYVLGMWTSDEGWVPLFNVELFNIGNLGFLIIIWTVAIIAAEVVKSVIGRYIYSFAIASLVGNVITICTVSILFFQGNIMNPRFLERLGEAFDGGNIPGFLQFIFGNANVIVIAIVFIILAVETVKIWIKAVRYS